MKLTRIKPYVLEIIILHVIFKGGFCLNRKVEICGVNTSKLPVLSNEEKDTLLKKIREGDEAAREQFIKRELKIGLEYYTKICK